MKGMNCKTIRCCLILLAFTMSLIGCDESAEREFKHFCSFEIDSLASPSVDGDDEYFCDCEMISSPLVGKPTIKIDCTLNEHIANLTNKIFGAEKLPPNTASLVLSYQMFTEIPEFIGDLKHLDMSNNRITSIKNLNFIHVKALQKVELSYNEITSIDSNAFSLLTSLDYLDLSYNQLVVVPANVFAPLSNLQTLVLSGNEGFGRLMGKNATNSSLTLLYLQLGVTKHLKYLELERCNLTSFNLIHGDDLESVNLGFNEIKDPTKLDLPHKLKRLELSGNPIRYLTSHSLPKIRSLEELVMEDMPYFGVVDEYSFYGFPNLRLLSLEGCKNLSTFHANAFGRNVVENETDLNLDILNLKGCNLRTLNSSLYAVFDHLKELSLDGNPFNCDCEVKWISELGLDSDLRCYRPPELQGLLLKEVTDHDELQCSNMSRFMNKLINCMILITLLIVCTVAIWCFLKQLRTDKNRRFTKIGPESPYHRVTIEPNRAEYSLN